MHGSWRENSCTSKWVQKRAFHDAAGETGLLMCAFHLGCQIICSLWEWSCPKCVTVPSALWVGCSRAVGAGGLSEGQGQSRPSSVTLARAERGPDVTGQRWLQTFCSFMPMKCPRNPVTVAAKYRLPDCLWHSETFCQRESPASCFPQSLWST